jgi:hypothetical protein
MFTIVCKNTNKDLQAIVMCIFIYKSKKKFREHTCSRIFEIFIKGFFSPKN